MNPRSRLVLQQASRRQPSGADIAASFWGRRFVAAARLKRAELAGWLAVWLVLPSAVGVMPSQEGDFLHPYYVTGPDGQGRVEAWSGYPLQFGGQRRFAWQEEMAADLRKALTGLPASPGAVLAGRYMSTDLASCDVENRLFTNLGAAGFPAGSAGIRFEWGAGIPPPAPVMIARVAGHLYYYRYRLGGAWESWAPTRVLAQWRRVPRTVAEDGSCRPVWLAMKRAAATGQVEVLASGFSDTAPFGVRAVVHATARGPRRPAAISESLIDGIIAAFHAGLGYGPGAVAAAAVLAPRLPGVTAAEVEAFAAGSVPGPVFALPALQVKGGYVQISPCDDRCQAGEVIIQPDAHGPFPEISGELLALQPV
jgi:hypothetical protein